MPLDQGSLGGFMRSNIRPLVAISIIVDRQVAAKVR